MSARSLSTRDPLLALPITAGVMVVLAVATSAPFASLVAAVLTLVTTGLVSYLALWGRR